MSTTPTINVSSDLEPLIPKFLKSRKSDVATLESAFQQKDYTTIASISHKIKGNAGSFGFYEFGKLAASFETHLKAQNFSEVQKTIALMKEYITAPTIVYVEDAA